MILPLLLVVAVGCRSHKESDIRVAETQHTQTTETIQTRTDSRTEERTEQAESADSIAWTVSADSVVQTTVDGTRKVLHRVRWTRTAYKPTATAKATAMVQQTDTTSAVTATQTAAQTAVQAHSESSRGGQPWWVLVATLMSVAGLVYYARHKIKARDNGNN